MQDITGFSGLVQNRLILPGTMTPENGAVMPNIQGNPVPSDSVDFARVMESALDKVSGLQSSAGEMQSQLELGVSDDLVGTMIASQKASLAFQGVIQARNRVVSAYETVFNMPV